MKLALLTDRTTLKRGARTRVRRNQDNLPVIEPVEPVEPMAPLVEWPGPRDAGPQAVAVRPAPITYLSPGERTPDAVEFRAEVRTKRFGATAVEQDRYGATVTATAASPHAMLAALVDALGASAEFRRPAESDDQLILEITLRR